MRDRGMGGNYVGRKIIFKFFLGPLIDPLSLFLAYFGSLTTLFDSTMLDIRHSTMDIIFFKILYYFSLTEVDFFTVFEIQYT